ncbi:MAG: cell wall hydrolase [Clostridia bacterium]|nr:cell wall hydrolase [Clostridia bacterium]
MYVPARTLARAFSLTLTQDGSAARLTGNIAPVKSGASFYDADAVYWLSRIISAESRGEPLIGQIAVGNVVLNRVRSSAFPNTIWGVIFDRKYGVQFSPVANGTIYQAPTASAVLAAKICLDGFSVSPDALYFLRPSASESSWIVKNREYLFTIRNHYFFA